MKKEQDKNAINLLNLTGRTVATGGTKQQDFVGSEKQFSIKE